jgi:hypothetical protein
LPRSRAWRGRCLKIPIQRWNTSLDRKPLSADGTLLSQLSFLPGGGLYPFFGLLLSPVIAGAAMSLSSVSVISNAQRLRKVRLRLCKGSRTRPAAFRVLYLKRNNDYENKKQHRSDIIRNGIEKAKNQ